jgi:hypothetical protein
MTPGYKERRALKHAIQFSSKLPVSGGFVQTIDLTNHLPALTFVGLKSRPQGNGGRKNRSGYAQEHKQANLDNAAFDVVQLESKSIGGVSEDLGLLGDDVGSIQNELC